MKLLIILLLICCAILSILDVVNTIRLKKLKYKSKNKFYKTPKLSSLHGKAFSDYIDYLTSGLH